MEQNLQLLPDKQLNELPPDQHFIQQYLRDTPRIWYDFNFSGAKNL